MPVYPSGGTIAQSVGSPGFGPAPAPSYTSPGSVRFNPADTPSFGYVPQIQGNRSTWTWAGWVKRSLLGSQQVFFGVNTDTNNHIFIEFQANDTIRIASNTAASTVIQLITTQFFRDPSQWYHITLTMDLTNATQADRVRLFVNGVRVTAFSTSTIPANTTTITSVNQISVQHYLGRYANSAIYQFGGYMAEVYLIDGLALSPSSFTETSPTTGQLIPISTGYTGSYGTNGFYLPFSSNALAVDLGQNKKVTGQDGYWPYNTLLVNTTNTNGQQNNTFLDSSTNNFTVVRAGNTTQGRFGPFEPGGGTTQANGYYSGYFDGTGDYLNFNGTTLNVGTGSFTLEGWVYITSYTFSSVISTWNSLTAPVGFILGLDSSGRPFFSIGTASGAGSSDVLGANAIPLNVWTHLAATKTAGSGGTMTLYVNGVSVGTNTTTRSVANTAAVIGRYYQDTNNYYLNGYISNVRVVTGSVVYASNFTVPTTPLTAISGTQVLTCQSSQFIDNSTNAFAITANGNAQPLPTNPFGMTAWSGYFDGTGDYLTTTSGSAFAFGTGDFTCELWCYLNSGTNNGLFQIASSVFPGVSGLAVSLVTNQLNIYYGASSQLYPFGNMSAGTWNHVALVRQSGALYVYLNGVRYTVVASDTTNYTGTTVGIGGYFSTSNLWNGSISNFRIVKGTAVYTSNFTPPTSPLTAISGTSLLTCQSSTFVDNSTNAFPITVFGNSYMGTLNNPFGNPINYTTPPTQSWSNYFNGSTQIRLTTTNTAFDIAGDFTVEGWFNLTAIDANDQIFTIEQAASPEYAAIQLQLSGTYQYLLLMSTNASSWAVNITTTETYKLGQWVHICVTRAGSAVTLWINGISTATATLAGALMSGGSYSIISGRAAGQFFTGSCSNFRFVNGQCLYNSTFTPSTSPLTLTSQGAQPSAVKWLTCQSSSLQDNSINRWPMTTTNVQTSVFSPFIPTQAWTAASNGSSAYFDGTGDGLAIATDPAFVYGTGDYTVECWVYLNTSGTFGVVGHGTGLNANLYLYINSTTPTAYFNNTNIATGPALTVGTWNHLAVTRSGTTLRVFTNGVSGTAVTNSTSMTAAGPITIGYSSAATQNINGYISGVRLLKGTALYTTPFVPPVLPPTNISNTSLLLNATNAGIYDATGVNNIETFGNAQVSTAVKKWGESSVSFDGSGDYLTITNASNSVVFGTSDFTIELWIYFSSFAGNPMVYDARPSGGNGAYVTIYAPTTGVLNLFVNSLDRITSSALSINTWYHVAISRVSSSTRMFINGTQAGATYSDSTNYLNGTGRPFIGLNSSTTNTSYFSGYMQDLRISRVGRYSGNFTPPAAAFAYNVQDVGFQQWTPTNISVTAGVGNDNLTDTVSDYGTDTGVGGQVRGNYCTWNPLKNSATLADGNLSVSNSSTTQWLGTTGTFGMTSGKWYWEVTVTANSSILIGLGTSNYATNGHPGWDANSWGYFSTNGQKYFNNSGSAYGASFTTNDVIGVAFDADIGTLTFYKNGVSQGTAFTGLTSGPYFPAAGTLNSTTAYLNAGQRAFAYTAPASHKCLVSTNLPTPTIGATSSTRADDYFNPVLYTGNDVSGRTITGVGFQPDLVWIKARNQNYSNQVTDVVRGPSKALLTNSTTAELLNRTVGYVSAFASDGFTVTAGSTDSAEVNQSGTTYVAWNWKANGAGVANTAGTISSTVSANTTSGCSIVTYTGTGTAGSVGHGLGVAPSFITIKQRNGTWSWMTYHVSIPVNSYLLLNGADAPATSRPDVYNGAPSSTVVNIGNNATVNGNGNTNVMYCFAPIAGFSAFGSYAGNGSSTLGPFIYTGFRPAYVLIKRSAGGTADWVVFDDARNTSNLTTQILLPNTAGAEITGVGTVLDLVSNGFLPRNAGTEVNAASSTYIYAAFAEFPFKYSRAR